MVTGGLASRFTCVAQSCKPRLRHKAKESDIVSTRYLDSVLRVGVKIAQAFSCVEPGVALDQSSFALRK